MNNFLKEISRCKLTRLIHTSHISNVRPRDFRSAFRKIRRFPYFKMYYDQDRTGPLNVVTDEIKTYPPGKWGSMTIKDAWKRYKEATCLRELPTYFDKLQSLTWSEYNLWYHTLQLPLKFPETLEFSKFITRTKVIDNVPDSIKDSFNSISSDEIGKTCQFLKHHLDNNFIQSAPFCPTYDIGEIERQSNDFICQMMDTIARSRFSSDFFKNYSTSPNSKIETFMKRSGYERLEAPEIVKDAEGCVKYRIRGNLAWQLRSRDILKEFININDQSLLNDGTTFQVYDYHPKMFDMEPADCEAFRHLPFSYSKHTNEYVRNIPGYWGNSPFKIGDPCAFSVLGVLNTDLSRDFCKQHLPKHQDIVDRYHVSEALLSAFTWTMAQAQNQGFTIYDELTYPFCASILITDGMNLRMVYYQLNSISSLWKPEDANLPLNVLWLGPKMKLFELDSEGKIGTFDEHAIHQILSTFTLPKADLNTEELQPYLKDRAPRDITELMIHYDPNTATEKQTLDYLAKSRHKQLFNYGKSHPNRLFYYDIVTPYESGEVFRKIVPGVDRLPAKVVDNIRQHRYVREMRERGKKKVLREPSKWM